MESKISNSNTLIDNLFLADKKRTRQDWTDGIAELMHRIRAMDTSIAPAAAAKRHISLCGCVHHFILVVSLIDRQYNHCISSEPSFLF